MRIRIKEQECGYLMKNGCFQKILLAGTYTYFKKLGYEVITVPITGQVKAAGIPMDILMKCPDFADRVVKVQIPDTSIAIRFVNDAYREVLTAAEAYFWNVFETNEFQVIDITNPYMEEALPRMYMDLMPAKYYKKITVKEGEIGLLYFDNRMEKRLDPGTYYFWNYGSEVSCRVLNMKIQQMEISGQEVLTADKVGIRLNVICNYRITEPEELVKRIDSVSSQLYTCAQLIIREYIGRYRLDELLAQKETISKFILETMRERQNDLCIEVVNGGIKDMILPGEIRDIMNTVLVAEKKAQANVIMRREEVASTRSLLNTAKLMEENQTLFQLKELEYVERICDKVGHISLNGGGSIIEQLTKLTGAKTDFA